MDQDEALASPVGKKYEANATSSPWWFEDLFTAYRHVADELPHEVPEF